MGTSSGTPKTGMPKTQPSQKAVASPCHWGGPHNNASGSRQTTTPLMTTFDFLACVSRQGASFTVVTFGHIQRPAQPLSGGGVVGCLAAGSRVHNK